MSDFDIENFPTSEAAKRMISTISEEFYRDSYVMKWIQQVMGMEWDDAVRIIVEELPKQFFPETATWGLCYHEMKWQLPVRENLSYEERRKLIYQKRDFKAPMTPYKMEKYLQKITGAEVYVMDCHDPGDFEFVPEHPNKFKVVFIKEGTLDSKAAIHELDRIKQSHTVYYTIEDRVITILNCKEMETMDARQIGIKSSVSFWRCHIFDGTDYFDGSLAMNSERQYNLILGLRYNQGEFDTQEMVHLIAMRVKGRIFGKERIDNARARFCLGINFWETQYFDGGWNFDGMHLMDSERRYDLLHRIGVEYIVSLSENVKVAALKAKGLSCSTDEDINVSENCRLKIDFWNLHYFDGTADFDGSLQLNQSRAKTTASTNVSMRIKEPKECVGSVTVTKTRNLCFFDGSVNFDGSKIMNSIYQKEVL